MGTGRVSNGIASVLGVGEAVRSCSKRRGIWQSRHLCFKPASEPSHLISPCLVFPIWEVYQKDTMQCNQDSCGRCPVAGFCRAPALLAREGHFHGLLKFRPTTQAMCRDEPIPFILPMSLEELRGCPVSYRLNRDCYEVGRDTLRLWAGS